MLNSVILMGRLTADPDYRTTQSGAALARFTLAVERDYAQNGERQTDFLDVIAWRGTADFVSKYFQKGQLVAVRGSVQVSSYTDREGNKRRSWDIVADQVYFAEGRKDSGGADTRPAHPAQPPRPQPSQPQPYQGEQQMMDGYAPSPSPYQAAGDDDLLF